MTELEEQLKFQFLGSQVVFKKSNFNFFPFEGKCDGTFIDIDKNYLIINTFIGIFKVDSKDCEFI